MTWSSPHRRGVPARDFEEARARAEEVRQRASVRHGSELGVRQRRVLSVFFSALAIAAMSFFLWSVLGLLGGLTGAALLTLGAIALWRLWS